MPLPLTKTDTGPARTVFDGNLSTLEDLDIGERISAHAERLWREAGRRGSPADYRDRARALVADEEIPH